MTIKMLHGSPHTTLICHVIDRHFRHNIIDDLNLLFSLGADPNVQDIKTHITPLIQWSMTFYSNWIKYGELLSLDILSLLLDKGANPLIKNKNGKRRN